MKTSENIEERVVIHNDGIPPTSDKYCIVNVGGEIHKAFWDGSDQIFSGDRVVRKSIDAWFYVEDIFNNEGITK